MYTDTGIATTTLKRIQPADPLRGAARVQPQLPARPAAQHSLVQTSTDRN